MKKYRRKATQWQQQDNEEKQMNKTEFIKVRCTLEEKQRIKAKAESTGRKFSEYCREILLNGEVVAVPKMTDNEKEAIAVLQPHQDKGRVMGVDNQEPFDMCQRSI